MQFAKKQRRRLIESASICNLLVGKPLQQSFVYFFGKMLPLAGQLKAGRVELKMDRVAYAIEGRLCLLCHELIRSLLHLELEAACMKTKGIFEVVQFYENLYEQAS